MKKHIAALLCVVGLMLYSAVSVWAAETVYPVSVENYMRDDMPCVKKLYQLSLSDDPAGIPTDDFEQNGYLYHLIDITQSHDVGVDTQTKTETITQDSDTGELSEVLKKLPGQKEVKTEDGYIGTLLLDHTSVQIKAKGYNTSTRNLAASRTYANLSDADLSLVPKTITDGGNTLTLTNVQWSSKDQEDGSTHYTASATYSGTATSRYATGYTVTANYTSKVAKTDCEIATYTAIFAGTKIEPEDVPDDESEDEPEDEPKDTAEDKPEDTTEPISSTEVEPETETEAEPDPELQTAAEMKTQSDHMTLLLILGIAGCLGEVVILAMAAYYLIRKEKIKGGEPK